MIKALVTGLIGVIIILAFLMLITLLVQALVELIDDDLVNKVKLLKIKLTSRGVPNAERMNLHKLKKCDTVIVKGIHRAIKDALNSRKKGLTVEGEVSDNVIAHLMSEGYTVQIDKRGIQVTGW